MYVSGTKTTSAPHRWLPRLILIVSGVAILAGAIAIYYVKMQLLSRSGETLALTAAGATDKLDLLIAERYGDIQLMAQAAPFLDQDANTISRYLESLQEAYPIYLWLSFADRSGRIVAATEPASVGMNVSSTAWFQTARMMQAPHIEDAGPSSEVDRALAVTLSAPVLTASGEFNGVVAAQVGLSTLEDTVAHMVLALQFQLGSQHHLEWQILNSAGDVLADSVLREEGTVNLSQLAVPSAILAQSSVTGFVAEQHRRRAIDVITGFARAKGSVHFPGLGWVVLVRVDRDDILAPINHVGWLLALGGGAFFMPMIGLLLWSTSQLRREWEESLQGREAMLGVVQAAHQMTSESNLESLLGQLTTIGRNLTGASYGALGVFDPSGSQLSQFITTGMDEETQQAIGALPTGKGLLGHLVETEGVLRLADLNDHPASSGVPPHHPIMNSFLGASIRTHGKLFGRLYLTNKRGPDGRPAMFTDLDEQVVSLLVAQAAIAIRNTTLLRELSEAETKLRLLLESTGEGICGLDLSGRCVFINAAGSILLGYQKEEVLGKNLHELVHDSYPDGFPYQIDQCPIFLAAQNGERCRVEEEHLHRKDGSQIVVEMSAYPIVEQGVLSGSVVTFQDISERTRAQAALAKAAQDLEWKNWELSITRDKALESARLKSEFLATMSHEIRTPMNGVIGMTEVLLDTPLTDEQRDYVCTLQRSGENLLRIINDILDFSKIEAGKLDIDIIDFDLRAVIESILELFGQSAQNKNLELIGLVSANTPGPVRGDPSRLRQVLTNLVGNAIKFTERGEVVLQTALVLDSQEHVVVRFDISDTGIGISQEAMSRLFQPFSQADGSTTRKYGGTGLGLAICKRLVDLMGGEIGINSNIGKGSQFWFTLRFGKQASPTTINDDAPVQLRNLHVCLVDDNATNRTLLQHYTTSWGMRNQSVENGPRAIELLRAATAQQDPFDIILIDMQMPGMNGLTLAKAIRTDSAIQPPHMVLLTSFGQRGDAKAAQEVGIAGYLTKPIRRSQLRDCIELIVRPTNNQIGLEHESSSPRLITRHNLAERAVQKRSRILVAEDNAVNQMVIVRLLEKLGYRADVVGNGQEALDAIRQTNQYELVLMDCHMPVLDGYETTAAIRKLEGVTRQIPIIALTANAMQDDRDKCLKIGMNDFLPKPATLGSLQAVIERWIKPIAGPLN